MPATEQDVPNFIYNVTSIKSVVKTFYPCKNSMTAFTKKLLIFAQIAVILTLYLINKSE